MTTITGVLGKFYEFTDNRLRCRFYFSDKERLWKFETKYQEDLALIHLIVKYKIPEHKYPEDIWNLLKEWALIVTLIENPHGRMKSLCNPKLGNDIEQLMGR